MSLGINYSTVKIVGRCFYYQTKNIFFFISGAAGLAVEVNARSLARDPAVVKETASGNVIPDVVAPIVPRPKNVDENNTQLILLK